MGFSGFKPDAIFSWGSVCLSGGNSLPLRCVWDEVGACGVVLFLISSVG